MSATQDIRNSDSQVAHKTMAKAAYDAQYRSMSELASNRGVAAPEVADASYYYDGLLTWGGVFYAVIGINFNDGVSFLGHSGGLVFGGGNAWGTAVLNRPLPPLKGQSVRFEANLLPGSSNVNFWLMDGTFLGTFIGAGIPGGAGVVGGQGSFS